MASMQSADHRLACVCSNITIMQLFGMLAQINTEDQYDHLRTGMLRGLAEAQSTSGIAPSTINPES